MDFCKTLMAHGMRKQLARMVLLVLACALPGVGQTTKPAAPAQTTRPQVPTAKRASTAAGPAVSATVARHVNARVEPVPAGTTPKLAQWAGLEVSGIEFQGVSPKRLAPLPSQLPQQAHTKLNPIHVQASLRRLFATGLYRDIVVEGVRHGNQVTLIFDGKPTTFLGQVKVHGIKNMTLHNRIAYAPGLIPGTAFDQAKLQDASGDLKQALQQNGFYEGKVFERTTPPDANALTNVDFYIELGKRARVDEVKVEGDSGMSHKTFEHKAKLHKGEKVTRDTVSRALGGLRKHYQKTGHLEAELKLESKKYVPPVNHLNYHFLANQNAVVKIKVDGVSLSDGKIRNLVPVYQEGDIDEDLLNEGSKRIHDYYQRKGYFNVKVTHTRTIGQKLTTIVYHVKLGPRSEVASVTISGNHYFSNEVLEPRLGVHVKSLFERHGIYSEALTEADAQTIEALYQMNGFTDVNVTPQTSVTYREVHHKKIGQLHVNYKVKEGKQHTFGTIMIAGNQKVSLKTLEPLLATHSHQPYNPNEVVNDRDALLTYYLAHGFDHAQVRVKQTPDGTHPDEMDVALDVTEGSQTFVRQVLVTGLHYTKRDTVQPEILVKAGQPLNQTALRNTERNLYNLTLFNEVHTSVENPQGDEPEKNVMVQFTEAKRWNVTYGFGLQAQTGTPSTSCPSPATLIQLGLNPNTYNSGGCSPNGKFGVSPVVEFDVSRINLFGTDQSVSLQTKYGTLEQIFELSYNHPHLFGHSGWSYSFGGGYSNAQDVVTYTASRLEGNFRVTQNMNRVNTMIYQFTYRRVKVDANSVQVAPNLIPLLSEPVRVGGPEFTWLHDTRRPEPLNAQHGWYNSVQEFMSDNIFASQANFNRFEWTNSSYYTFGAKKYTIARNTVFGFERAFGQGQYEQIPLPERLYAGGAQSLRGFGLNEAGPRDSLTGFPIGGAGLFVNQTELRLPPPHLPYVGTSLSFVLFHDMGNVFNNSSDIWPSFFRVRQPDSQNCRDDSLAVQEKVTRHSSTNPTGTCSFNDFSHAVGLGLRYHTPIGPLRLDFSYNLNPPIYPIEYTYSTCTGANGTPTNICPSVGQAPHFNVFFSIGQAF
uniref:Outer membrane protein assembly factor n=1 Tax=Acidobacterium capsulatum TaxID=33075 RepID=A0A7V4XRI2_9BACT